MTATENAIVPSSYPEELAGSNLCILALDLAKTSGWALIRRDGSRDSGVERFKFDRESRGMVYRNFGIWFRKLVMQERADIVISEHPLSHNSADAVEITQTMSGKVKEIHEEVLELYKKRRNQWSEEDWAKISQATAILLHYGIQVPQAELHYFDHVQPLPNELTQWVRRKLGLKTVGEKREELREQGVKGRSKMKVESDPIPESKAMTRQYAEVILGRAPETSDEGDAVCLREMAVERYAPEFIVA
jgi:hypothetical protein